MTARYRTKLCSNAAPWNCKVYGSKHSPCANALFSSAPMTDFDRMRLSLELATLVSSPPLPPPLLLAAGAAADHSPPQCCCWRRPCPSPLSSSSSSLLPSRGRACVELLHEACDAARRRFLAPSTAVWSSMRWVLPALSAVGSGAPPTDTEGVDDSAQAVDSSVPSTIAHESPPSSPSIMASRKP